MDIRISNKILRKFLKRPMKTSTALLLVVIFSVVSSYSSGFFSELGKNHLEQISGKNTTTIKRKLVQGDEWSKIVKCDHMSETFSVKLEKIVSSGSARIQIHSPSMGRYTANKFEAKNGFSYSFSSAGEVYIFQLDEINAKNNYVAFTLEIEEQGN